MLRTACVVVLVSLVETPGVGPEELAEYWPPAVRAGWFLVGFVAAFVVGWYLFEPAVTRVIRRRNRNNPTIQEAISRYVRLLVVVVAVGVGAGVAGFGGVLAGSALVLAALTLALGVAGQQVVGSLLSGLVLVLDPEFNVGDYVVWEDGEGTVLSITLRVTRVRTPSNELVTIPNTVLTEQAITRPYGRRRVMIVDRVEVGYDDDVDLVKGLLVETAAGLDGVLERPAPEAFVDELADDGVVIRVHYWLDAPRPHEAPRITSRYTEAIKERLSAADVTISPASQHELQGSLEIGDTE